MALTIDLAPEVEERLQREAEKQGLSADAYAQQLIERSLPIEEREPLWETLSPEEWKRQFRAWAASHDATRPPLPPEAYERASFYGDCG